jgi:hypothetical protein
MLAFLCLFFLPCVFSAPLFGLGSPEATGAPTPLSLATVNATLLRAAEFSRAAYCSGSSIESWNCGIPCQSLSGVTFRQAGGSTSRILANAHLTHPPHLDQGTIPFCVWTPLTSTSSSYLIKSRFYRARYGRSKPRRCPRRHRSGQHVRPCLNIKHSGLKTAVFQYLTMRNLA